MYFHFCKDLNSIATCSASQRSLALEVTAHKQTLSELQRTRTSLQYLRSTTQNELKRKEKEVERVLDRWNKVSDAQIKLAGAQSGLHCANFAVGGEECMEGKGLMEEALEQAEEARKELVKENEGFRSVILGTANALQSMVYNVKGLGVDVHVETVSFGYWCYRHLKDCCSLHPSPIRRYLRHQRLLCYIRITRMSSFANSWPHSGRLFLVFRLQVHLPVLESLRLRKKSSN